MSLGSTLKHVLGFVAGIIIPGAKAAVVNSIHAVQQEFADLYGVAATRLANDLKTSTDLDGPAKVFHILAALVETAKSQGFKGDVKVLKDSLLDVAQTAYRNSLPSLEEDAKQLLVSLHLGAPLTAVAELVLPAIEHAAEGAVAGVLHLDQAHEAA